MATCKRCSPVSFSVRPEEVENRDGWTVALKYGGEGDGPFLFDLSHRVRYDVQDGDISGTDPFGVSVPAEPGGCVFENGVLINRMNRTQASVWHLCGEAPEAPDGAAFTETTDVTVFLALSGPNVFFITEKLTSLDLADPKLAAPFLIQGPFSHVPCQVVVLDREGSNGTVMLTCSRGYAHSMVHAVLDAGQEFGLRPAGEITFLSILEDK